MVWSLTSLSLAVRSKSQGSQRQHLVQSPTFPQFPNKTETQHNLAISKISSRGCYLPYLTVKKKSHFISYTLTREAYCDCWQTLPCCNPSTQPSAWIAPHQECFLLSCRLAHLQWRQQACTLLRAGVGCQHLVDVPAPALCCETRLSFPFYKARLEVTSQASEV